MIQHEAKYVCFMMNKERGEPEIWGTDGLNHDIVGAPLAAEPCLANINLSIDDTDLAPFIDINMFHKDLEMALWGLNDYGIIADVYCLRNELQKKCELEKRNVIKDRVYNLALTLQADYTQDVQEFTKKQQDVRHRLIHTRARTKVEQVQRGQDTTFAGISPHAQGSNSLQSYEGNSLDALSLDPSNSSGEFGIKPIGKPSHHRLAWYVYAQNNICKLCNRQGHFSKYCDNPHDYCHQELQGQCLMNPQHISYTYSFDSCPYEGQTNVARTMQCIPTIITYHAA
jgi:hypothetical protein